MEEIPQYDNPYMQGMRDNPILWIILAVLLAFGAYFLSQV